MKIRILALVAIALLATSTVAFAATNKLTGHLKTQKDGKITIKVKTKKGVVKKVTSLSVSNFKSTCSDQNFNKIPNKTVSAKLGAFKVRKSKDPSSGKTYYSVFVSGKKVGVDTFNAEITFSSKKGKKAGGTLSFNFPDAQGAASCGGGGRFSAKVK
jgi:hypothetical protein